MLKLNYKSSSGKLLIKPDLNTSYVEVKQLENFDFDFNFEKFKYILC